MHGGICDVWGMSRALDFATIAIEVKVSRGDYRSESHKVKEISSRNGHHLGNSQYILCQAGLIQPEEVSENWGLLWYDIEKQRIVNKKHSPFLDLTADRKLQILLYFLNNGNNEKRPLLKEDNTIIPVTISTPLL